jgi:hypothetical protein
VALPDEAARLIREINASRPTVLVSFGSPYVISQVPETGAYLLAWTANPVSEAAVAAALTGAAITGRAPIRIPPGYPIGAGLQREAR